MATRSYVTPSEYDPADAEFTIATIDGNPYLQMGALDRDDTALFRSLIDGYAGFFLNGQRVAAVRITERYDPTNGVQLESLPTLTTGGEYHVRFTQARPGRDGSNRRTGGMQPFSDDGMMGRRYGPMIPFNRYNRPRMLPYTGDGMTGKPSGDPMRGRLPKKREGAQDILQHLDGQPELVAEYMWDLIMDRVPDPTGSEIVSILMALPIGSRLPFSWLDGQPSIPLNTASWHGQFQLRTAYSAGSLVTDAGNVFIYIVDIPATNTIRPGADAASRVEHLDVGNPLDITNVAKAGLTFTFTRRTGTFSLTITPTDIYNAIGNMNPTQLIGLRNLIGAAPVVHDHDGRYYTETEINNLLAGKSNTGHNHDTRYYTESESNSRFAPRSTRSATATNVLAALVAMSTAQEGQARSAINAASVETPQLQFSSNRVPNSSRFVQQIGNFIFGRFTVNAAYSRAANVRNVSRRFYGIVFDNAGNIRESMTPQPSTTSGWTGFGLRIESGVNFFIGIIY